MKDKRLNRFIKPIRAALFLEKKMKESFSEISSNADAYEGKKLTPSLSENLYLLKEIFKNCSDVVFRDFLIGKDQTLSGVLIWTDGLADKLQMNESIMRSLLHEARLLEPNENMGGQRAFVLIRDGLLSVSDIREQEKLTDIIDAVLTGESVILIDQVSASLVVSTKSWESRDVAEPVTEGVVRGPRQGFTENIRTCTALIRRIIKTPQLKMETFKAGKLTKTDLIVVYIDGIADDEVIEEVRRRIRRIDVDSILESAYVEELIEDHPYSPFPQIEHTERPDKAAAHLLEGRIVILIDGTPFVLLVPTVFTQFLQSSEDYYERYLMSFAVRMVRYLFFFLALTLPSVYVAATTYHHEMLPTSILISIAGSREGVPFPAFVEALLMEITFEALREAGVRLPKPVGQAVSIVGALVIGEAAVAAGIVSPAMVIVVSLTAIASFTIPAFNIAISIRMLRFPIMILAAVFGFYGIALGLLAMVVHLCSLRSFGIPYFAPLAPLYWGDLKDVIFRAPWWMMRERPRVTSPHNVQRQDTPKPERPEQG